MTMKYDIHMYKILVPRSKQRKESKIMLILIYILIRTLFEMRTKLIKILSFLLKNKICKNTWNLNVI